MSNVPARFDGTVNATLLPLIAIGAALVKIFATAFVNVSGLANKGATSTFVPALATADTHYLPIKVTCLLHLMLVYYYLMQHH